MIVCRPLPPEAARRHYALIWAFRQGPSQEDPPRVR